jgi:putative aldouronate transport system substrate-binding protein
MKRLALLLALMIVLSSADGCSEQGAEPASNAPDSGSVAATSTQDPYTAHIYVVGEATTEDMVEVNAKLSELSLAKYNTTINMQKAGWGSFNQTLTLMLSSGEELDIFANLGQISNYAANGQVLPLNDLLASHGKDTLSAISEADWSCVSIGDEIFGVPGNKDKAASYGVAFTKSMFDELGADINSIKTLDDVHDLLVQAKEAFPNVYGMASNTGSMWSIIPFVDSLNTGAYLGVIMDAYGSDLTVENLYESQEYYDIAKRMYEWNQEGLLMPDGSTNTETHIGLRSAGMMFGNFCVQKPGFDEQEGRSSGVEIVSAELYPALSFTSSVAMGWSIATNSEKPERAMEILDMMYMDFDLNNILMYGVEGKHWEIKDEANGLVGFPEGVDASTTGYQHLTWIWPNQLNSYVWENDQPDIWEQMDEFNRTATNAPTKGFTFDSAPVINQVTACQNVFEKYHNALMNGQLDPDEAIPQFNDELKASGLDEIIAEKQKQLDAWAAAR